MSTKIQGWAGDFTAQVPGREPLTALVALSSDEGDNPVDQMNFPDLKSPYWLAHASNMTPGAMPATVTDIHYNGVGAWRVEIVPGGSDGDGTDPWAPGVNLFAISIFCQSKGDGSKDWFATTYCSVIVPTVKSNKIAKLTIDNIKAQGRRTPPKPIRGK